MTETTVKTILQVRADRLGISMEQLVEDDQAALRELLDVKSRPHFDSMIKKIRDQNP